MGLFDNSINSIGAQIFQRAKGNKDISRAKRKNAQDLSPLSRLHRRDAFVPRQEGRQGQDSGSSNTPKHVLGLLHAINGGRNTSPINTAPVGDWISSSLNRA